MQSEQDRDLTEALSSYRVKDDPVADEALLERIMSMASAMPRTTPKPFWSRIWASEWMGDAVAFAAVATLGFWIGAVSPQGVADGRLTTISVSSSGTGDIDPMVFGVESWREVTL